MSVSFEEKSVWITLAALVLVFGFYFVAASRMMAAGITTVAAYGPLLAVVVVLLVLVLSAGHAAVAIASRPEGRDERDRVISWRAEHGSSWLLGAGVVAAIAALALPVERIWIANGLLAVLVLSEVHKRALQLYYYRRGV